MIDAYIFLDVLNLIRWGIYKLHLWNHINRKSKYYLIKYYKLEM